MIRRTSPFGARRFGVDDPALTPKSAEEAAACTHDNLESVYGVDGEY